MGTTTADPGSPTPTRAGDTIADERSDRTVLTTGANSGIGLATALAVARRGFRSVGSVHSEAKAQLGTG